jgi:FkbM family methyltransferase
MPIYLGDKKRKNVLIPCDHGLMIVNRFDSNNDQVGQGGFLLDHGNSCTKEAEICHRYLNNKTNPVIFDIGANIGSLTSWFCQIFPNGKIYCFEPQRQVFQMLCGNIAINNWENCYTYNMALGNKNAVIKVNEPDYFTYEDFGTFSLNVNKIRNCSQQVNNVEIMMLDDFVDKFSITNIDLIKIDAEDMTQDVIFGAQKTLKKFQPGLFVEYTDYSHNKLANILNMFDQSQWHHEIYDNNVLIFPKIIF